jgi:DNA-binding response OmpR family regulator
MTDHTAAQPPTATQVLVVDDEPYFCAFLCSSLQEQGYVVHTAVDGQDALNVFQASSIDLVLTDIQMPNLDGYALCTQLRACSDVPIIILSSRGDPDELLQGFGAGANEYITKPFQLNEVEARIQRLLRKTKLQAA